jgi:propanol-preferring alcohol dehydrogenase
MRAARLHEYGQPLQFDDVPVPDVKDDEILIKMVASYVCSSDLSLIKGILPFPRLPLTLGHDNVGYVEKTGRNVPDLKQGTAVAVYGAWGCGHCRLCRQGEEQLCGLMQWVGFGPDGGYADYLLVTARRHLLELVTFSPIEAAPLLDAALTPYRAVKKVLPHLYAGSAVVVIGIGNLGQFGIQILKAISPGVKIIAIDKVEDRLRLGLKLGVDYIIDAASDVKAEVRKLTDGEGAQAVLDMVGSNGSMQIASQTIGRKGIIMVVGVAGGVLPYSFLGLPVECVVTGSDWGTYTELEEVVSLARAGKIKSTIRCFDVKDINEVHNQMRAGTIEGQAVITF